MVEKAKYMWANNKLCKPLLERYDPQFIDRKVEPFKIDVQLIDGGKKKRNGYKTQGKTKIKSDEQDLLLPPSLPNISKVCVFISLKTYHSYSLPKAMLQS